MRTILALFNVADEPTQAATNVVEGLLDSQEASSGSSWTKEAAEPGA